MIAKGETKKEESQKCPFVALPHKQHRQHQHQHQHPWQAACSWSSPKGYTTHLRQDQQTSASGEPQSTLTVGQFRRAVEKNLIGALLCAYILLSIALLVALSSPNLLGNQDTALKESRQIEDLDSNRQVAALAIAAKTALGPKDGDDDEVGVKGGHGKTSRKPRQVPWATLWSVPLRGQCQPMRVQFCARLNSLKSKDSQAAYSSTLMPNQFAAWRQQHLADIGLAKFESVIDIKCYALLQLFLCSLYAPKCVSLANNVTLANELFAQARRLVQSGAVANAVRVLDGETRNVTTLLLAAASASSASSAADAAKNWSLLVPPCRSLCKDAFRKCSFFFEVLALNVMEAASCDELPESSNANVCVGHRELEQLQLASERQACSDDKFRCVTSGECIERRWRCDGYADCVDQSDELSCGKCNAKTHFHCGPSKCIEKREVCNGVQDCADGRDERECLRLAPAAGKQRVAGRGRLDIWSATLGGWRPACGAHLSQQVARDACRALGYERVDWTRIVLGRPLADPAAAEFAEAAEHFVLSTDVASGTVSLGSGSAQADTKLKQQQRADPASPAAVAHNDNEQPKPKSLAALLFNAQTNIKQCPPNSGTVLLQCGQFECGRPAAAPRALQQAPKASAKPRDDSKNTKRLSKRLVVGGSESLPGEFPYIAALHGGPDEVFFCGGVVIGADWLLTAAHCVGNRTQADGWTVRVGITRRTSAHAALHARRLRVARIIKHPAFNNGSLFNNDIALVQLVEPVEFNHLLRPICLPPPSLAPLATSGDSTRDCVVVGFGKAQFSADAGYLHVAHFAHVPIVDRQLCSGWYQAEGVALTGSMLCAGHADGARDACQGDSGSGLFCRLIPQHKESSLLDPTTTTLTSSQDTPLFLAGVVSFGIRCATPRLPGVYTAVPHYVDWIRATMQQQSGIKSSSSSTTSIKQMYDRIERVA